MATVQFEFWEGRPIKVFEHDKEYPGIILRYEDDYDNCPDRVWIEYSAHDVLQNVACDPSTKVGLSDDVFDLSFIRFVLL